MNEQAPAIGIIGGSGLYQMEELRDATEHTIDTPFGSVFVGNDMWLIYLVCIGLGTAIGAGIGWLSAQKIGEDDDVPPPPRDVVRPIED